ncbi:MAG: glycosyltransferase family 2 protein [Candidatus Dormibacteria bacterium]
MSEVLPVAEVRPSGEHLPADAFPRPAPAPRSLGELAAHRLLEVVPGFTLAAALALPLVTALWYPELVAWAVIAFDLYWLLRSVAVVRQIFRSYQQVQIDKSVNWTERCRLLELPEGAPLCTEIHHVALIPTYTESYQVLRATLDAWADTDFPAERKMVAVITRTTDLGGIENVRRLQGEFDGRLARVIHILDPVLPGVVPGKSAAMAYGGPVLRDELDRMGLDPRRVIVTDLDSDFRVHPQYLANVTFRYCSNPNRDTTAFQPLPMFHNNQWKVPFAVRVLASTCTQWHMFLQQKLERLVLFSSYSASMHLITDIGYWDCDIIPEDSRFYWKSFFRYGKRFQVSPIFLPVYGDAPRAHSYAATIGSQYRQIQRWAWGVTDIPYVLRGMIRHREIPLWLRIKRTASLFRTHITWVFMPLFLFIGGYLPIWASTDFALTEFGRHLGFYSACILTGTLLNACLLIYLDYRCSPPFPEEWGILRRTWAVAQLLTYPIVGLALSVMPALDAQARLLMGRYLEYRVTEKAT